MAIRRLFTHALHIKQYGKRKDGSEYQRFEVWFPEDVAAQIKQLKSDIKYNNEGFTLEQTNYLLETIDLLFPQFQFLRDADNIAYTNDGEKK